MSECGVLVVGAGGLSLPVIRVLHGAGAGPLTVVDPDRVEIDNLHRQILFRNEDIGRFKVDVLASRLGPGLDARRERLTDANGPELVAGRACVFDGTDSFADKYRINDLCLAADVPLVHAGAVAFRGQVLSVMRGGPCLRCLLDSPPDAARDECRVSGVFGPAVGAVAALAASEILGILGGRRRCGWLWRADLAQGRLSRAWLEPVAGCACRNGAGAHGRSEMV